MRTVRVVLAWAAALVVVAVVGLAAFLFVAPPDLLRVATGYSAKMVCSNRFIAGRDPAEVMAVDVQAPGHPLLRLVHIGVDEREQLVTARLLGMFATGVAVYRPGLGCASVPDGDVAAARQVQVALPPAPVSDAAGAWPAGDGVEPVTGQALADILDNKQLVGPQMRAVVVIKNGQLVAEAYGPSIDATTPLLGWSMAKTVNALLLGRAMAEGRIGLDDTGLFPNWQDERRDISVRDLLGMASGLGFNEDYGDVSDVNRMLFLTPDMPAFASSLPAIAAPGTAFAYSSGTANLLTRLWMDRVGEGALAYPREKLFEPLGMGSAVMEADARGTLVGSSYVYATGRDWARLGQFVLQDGVWQGERLVPAELMAMMRTGNGLPGGYSQAQTWLAGPHESEGEPMVGLPGDTIWLQGHDGQTIAVIPSAGLVVVRLGLTPWKLDYWPERLVQAIVEAIG